jgi:hypothetical protein
VDAFSAILLVSLFLFRVGDPPTFYLYLWEVLVGGQRELEQAFTFKASELKRVPRANALGIV